MLKQEAMIERVRRVCREDGRLAAAMMYGSFAQGEGDEFSDIEFVLFSTTRIWGAWTRKSGFPGSRPSNCTS